MVHMLWLEGRACQMTLSRHTMPCNSQAWQIDVEARQMLLANHSRNKGPECASVTRRAIGAWSL